MADISLYIQKLINVSVANDLLNKYEYEGSEIYLYLFTYLISKAYNLIIPPKSLFSYHIKAETITNGFPGIFEDIAQYFITSNKDKSFLILELSHLYEKEEDIESVGHVNLIIYDRISNTLEHYEPNGKFYNIYWDGYGKGILNILYKNLKRYIPDLKFKSSVEIHGFKPSDKEMVGLQGIEHRQNHKGHCQIWCYLLAELITKYPEYSTESIIRIYLDLDNIDGLTKRNFHRKIKMIVRGFYHSALKRIMRIEEFGHLNVETFNTLDQDIRNQSIKIVKDIISIICYDTESEEINYLLGSTLKSYIIIFGLENTKKIFTTKENKNEIVTINNVMMIMPREQFLATDKEFLKSLLSRMAVN